MRPKKTRWVTCEPGERCFRPVSRDPEKLEGVVLHLDELEVMRLAHLEEMDQTAIAVKMKLHQSTVSRILSSAHRKVTDSLVNLKAIKVDKGSCRVIPPKERE